jgi:hypothetical protein
MFTILFFANYVIRKIDCIAAATAAMVLEELKKNGRGLF